MGSFADELTRFAASSGDPVVAAQAAQVRTPVTVAVTGRTGVGSATVRSALRLAGVSVCEPGVAADIDAYVVAEVVKPEDRAHLAAADRPAVLVLNKADLSGYAQGGPMAVAQSRAARYRRLTGVATVPMAAHLAVATVDAEMLAALDLLAREPADLSSVDRFVGSAHPLSTAVRQRLVEVLDIVGIAHAVLAVRSHGATAPRVLPALLRRLSNLDPVLEQLRLAAAEPHYRRTCDAVRALEALAVDDVRVAGFLNSDAVVLARMAAAEDVVTAAGLTLGDAPYERRALRWRTYSTGPVSPVHRGCGQDIARGSLLLLTRAGAP